MEENLAAAYSTYKKISDVHQVAIDQRKAIAE